MAYTTPGTAVAGQVLTAAFWNTNVRDNLDALRSSIRVSQVLSTTYSTVTTGNTATYSTTGLSLAITPSSASSKILVVANMAGVVKGSENVNNATNLRLVRGSTGIYDIGPVNNTGTALLLVVQASLIYLDSPSTTSSTTYAVEQKNSVAASTSAVQYGGATSTLTLFEILP